MSFFKGMLFFLIAAASFKIVDILLPAIKGKTKLTKVVLYLLTLGVAIVGLVFFYYGGLHFVDFQQSKWK